MLSSMHIHHSSGRQITGVMMARVMSIQVTAIWRSSLCRYLSTHQSRPTHAHLAMTWLLAVLWCAQHGLIVSSARQLVDFSFHPVHYPVKSVRTTRELSMNRTLSLGFIFMLARSWICILNIIEATVACLMISRIIKIPILGSYCNAQFQTTCLPCVQNIPW